MGNKIFKALLDEKIENFKSSFSSLSTKVFFDEDTKKLIHPGEYGMYREAICKEFIRFVIPKRLDINQGFIISSEEEISHQCDIIVYDSQNTPLIENGEKQRFFPIETICAVGEVKSTLSKVNFKKALNKLSKTKRIRSNMSAPHIIRQESKKEFNPLTNKEDQLITFLICQKLDFDISNIENEIKKFYDDENINLKHNFIISIEDGIFLYENNGVAVPYPISQDKLYKDVFIKEDVANTHFKVFSSNMFLTTSSSTILFPDIASYIK